MDETLSADLSSLQEPELSILDIIGNITRRRILTLLSREPHYASQLARILKVSQPAIVKQLQLLENFGILKAERRQIEGEKGPERLYFHISKELLLFYSIGSYFVRGRCWETSAGQYEKQQDYLDAGLLSLNEIAEELMDLEKEISKKEQEISRLETRRNSILHQVSLLLSEDKDLGQSRAYLQREIVRALLLCDDKICVEELAKTLDKGESEIVTHLRKLGRRGLVELDAASEDVRLTTDS